MMRTRIVSALLAAVAAAGADAAAASEGFALRVVEEVTTGGLDAPAGIPVRKTTLQLRHAAAAWLAEAEVPWLRVAGAADGLMAPGARAGALEQGIGAPRFKVTLPLRAPAAGRTGLDLVLRLQGRSGRGVAGLGGGSGSAGQSVRLELLRPLGAWNLSGQLGVARGGERGGSAAGGPAWQGGLGAFRLFTPGLEAGGWLDLRQRSTDGAPLREATAYATLLQGPWRLQLYASRSLARGAAGAGAGINLQASF